MVGHAPDNILKAFKCSLTLFTTDFDIGAAATAGIGRRDGNDQHGSGNGTDHFGERLCKGKLGIKGPCGKFLIRDQLPRVGHPFIDQNDRWPIRSQ